MKKPVWVSAAGVEEFTDGAISEQRAWYLEREGLLPKGVAFHDGRKVLFHLGRLQEWMDSGGSSWPGGWRRLPTGGDVKPSTDLQQELPFPKR